MTAHDRPAVVAGGWLGVAGAADRVPLPEGWGLVDVAEVAAGLGCPVAYLLDTPAGGFGAVDERCEITGGTAGDVWRVRVEVEGAGRVSVVYVPGDSAGASGPWQAMTAPEVIAAMVAAERLLGVPWGESIGRTAERLILATHPRERGGVRLDLNPSTPPPAAAGNLELAWLSWRRDPTEEERGAAFVHNFDANAQYLAAWQAAELPHGEPMHRNGPAFDPKVAGLWRLASLPANTRPELPPCWTVGREWFTTPTVVRMIEAAAGYGWAPEVVEAWVWPRRSRFLRAAGERLRDARAEARAEVRRARLAVWDASEDQADELVRRMVAAETVEQAVKAIYRVQTGRFNMGAREGAWARPEWGHVVRATARVNLHRRLCQLGRAPFAIATDGLLFATDEPDPFRFAAFIGLPIGDGLGQFSYEGSSPAAPVWDAYGTGRKGGGAGALFKAAAANRIEES